MKPLLTACLSLFLCLQASLTAQEDLPEILERTSRDNVFQVVGTSFNGVQYVTQMSDRMVLLGKRFLPVPKDPPQPVLVKLIPAQMADFDAPYIVRPQSGGEVLVLIRWGMDTRFEDVCQALASGLLLRTAIWHYGGDAAARVPDWFEMALGQELIVAIRPAMIDQQRKLALESAPLSFEKLTTAEGPFGIELSDYQVDAGWLFRFLEGQTKSSTEFKRICSAFLAGMNPNAIIVKAFPDRFENSRQIELWWAVGFQATVLGRQPPFASLQESRAKITSLAFITFQKEDGDDIRVAGQNLWQWHEIPEARLAMQYRLREAKIELQKVNPIYFNSLLSLGLLFEAALGDSQESFDVALGQFALDFQSAQNFELEMRRLLRW